jgi:hypothetical protein
MEKLGVLVSRNCGKCEEVLEKYKEMIDKGELEVLYVENEDGRGFAELLKIKEVPTFIEISADEKKAEICVLDDDLNVKECVELEAKRSQ